MNGVNKAILIGNVGKEPEVRYTSGGSPVANFSLATNESYKDRSGEWQTKTEWHNIVVWGKFAESIPKFATVGALVYVEGKIQTRAWDGKDGQKKYTTEILANTVRGLTKSNASSGAPDESNEPAVSDEDIPF